MVGLDDHLNDSMILCHDPMTTTKGSGPASQ